MKKSELKREIMRIIKEESSNNKDVVKKLTAILIGILKPRKDETLGKYAYNYAQYIVNHELIRTNKGWAVKKDKRNKLIIIPSRDTNHGIEIIDIKDFT